MNMPEMRRRLRDPLTRTYAAIEFGDYFRDMCLMFDCEMDTALRVSRTIAEGLVKEFEKKDKAE